MQNMIDTVLGLKGLVSEPVRSEVAHRLADMVSRGCGDRKAHWDQHGRESFLRGCGVPQDRACVPDDFEPCPTKVAQFMAKWNAVQMFSDDGEWVDFTQAMDSLRRTMLEELAEITDDVVYIATTGIDGPVDAVFATEEDAEAYKDDAKHYVDIQRRAVEV